MSTLIALDVDGVLVPFDPRTVGSDVTWITCQDYDHATRPEVISELARMTSQADVIGVWLSPWGSEAAAAFGDHFGSDWPALTREPDQMVSPRYWWRADALADHLASSEGITKAIWCEDDADNFSDHGSIARLREVCESRGIELYFISPDSRTGMLRVHLDAIAEILDR